MPYTRRLAASVETERQEANSRPYRYRNAQRLVRKCELTPRHNNPNNTLKTAGLNTLLSFFSANINRYNLRKIRGNSRTFFLRCAMKAASRLHVKEKTYLPTAYR